MFPSQDFSQDYHSQSGMEGTRPDFPNGPSPLHKKARHGRFPMGFSAASQDGENMHPQGPLYFSQESIASQGGFSQPSQDMFTRMGGLNINDSYCGMNEDSFAHSQPGNGDSNHSDNNSNGPELTLASRMKRLIPPQQSHNGMGLSINTSVAPCPEGPGSVDSRGTPLSAQGAPEMGLFPVPVARERKDASGKGVENSRISSNEEGKKEITLKPPLRNPFLEAATAAYYNSHGNHDNVSGVAMTSKPRRMPTKMWISAFKDRPRMPTDFEHIDTLGEGVHSRVGYARRRLDGQVYAIKTLKTSINSESEGKHLIREACAHAVLVGCPHLTQYFGCWLDDGVLSIQTELCSLGSLQQLVGSLPREHSTGSDRSGGADGKHHTALDVSREDETQDADAMDDLDGEEEESSHDHELGSQPCHQSFIYATQSQGEEGPDDPQHEKSLGLSPDGGVISTPNAPKNGGIPECLAWLILSTVGETLSYMHAKDMVHLDLRPSNLFIASTHPLNNFGDNGKINKKVDPSSLVDKLLRGEGMLRVGDLGQCMRSDEKVVQEGEHRYCPRELEADDSCEKDLCKADIFSLGATVYELILGRALHSGEDGDKEWQTLRDGKFAPHIEAAAASTAAATAALRAGGYSEEIVRTLKLMMDADPRRRPSAVRVVDHCKNALERGHRAVSPSHANAAAASGGAGSSSLLSVPSLRGTEAEMHALRVENAQLKARLQALSSSSTRSSSSS